VNLLSSRYKTLQAPVSGAAHAASSHFLHGVLAHDAPGDGGWEHWKTVMITRHGRPAGYLIGYEALNRLLDRLEDMEDLYWMYQGLAEYRAGEGRPFEEFVAELESREQ